MGNRGNPEPLTASAGAEANFEPFETFWASLKP